MDCLKCPNYWGNIPNEQMCENCANSINLSDILQEMPPLFMKNQTFVQVCTLKSGVRP